MAERKGQPTIGWRRRKKPCASAVTLGLQEDGVIVNMTQVEAKSWNRFLTRYFAIVPELLGAHHEFEFDGKTIEVVLPSKKDVSEHTDDRKRAKTFLWRVVEGKDIPLGLWIDSVDVRIKIDHKVTMPDQVLCRPPNAYDILTEKNQEQLDTLAKKYAPIAERAFDVWLRVLRWKTSNGLIGRPHIVGPQSGWGTYLIESTTGQRFWSEHVVMIHPPDGSPVTLTEWNAVEHALKNKLSSPVFYDLMFDAAEHLRLEDLQRSVVDAAVACEIYMRQKLMQRLPAGLQRGVKKYIDEAKIRQVLDNLLPEALDDGQRHVVNCITSSLHKLFDARNAILHKGIKSDLTIEECQRYLEATRKLLAIE